MAEQPKSHLIEEMDAAFNAMLQRYRITSSSEPYLLFAAMALEQDRLAALIADLETRLERAEAALKPKLIVPAKAARIIGVN